MKNKILEALGLYAEEPWITIVLYLRRRIRRVDHKLCEDYLRNARIPKLHIGSGGRCLAGWLNVDIALMPDVVQMNAARPFPFVDATFSYIFTEHMIEHVSFEDGMRMLRECYRVLKTGGAIRVTTPSLAASIGLYNETPSPLQQHYLEWFSKTFFPERAATPANAINAMFRMWGHQYIYDESTLAKALQQVGFRDAVRQPLMHSGDELLRNLENVARYPDGLLQFESIAYEARK